MLLMKTPAAVGIKNSLWELSLQVFYFQTTLQFILQLQME